MFSAASKYVKAFFYMITFQINKAGETLRADPGVMSATYDSIIQEKKARLNQYKDAVASMIAQEERKKARLKQLTEDIDRLEKLKAGAAAKARRVVESHGGDPEAVKQDPEYLKCQSAYKDFSNTLEEKNQSAEELEADLNELITNTSNHRNQIVALMRELEKLREEKHDAVADVLSAQEEQQVADLMTGITEHKTAEELQEVRELRQKAKASARMSRELAGLDVKRAEDEFLEYATQSQAVDEFDQLIGLSAKADAEATVGEAPSKLPEQ